MGGGVYLLSVSDHSKGHAEISIFVLVYAVLGVMVRRQLNSVRIQPKTVARADL